VPSAKTTTPAIVEEEPMLPGWVLLEFTGGGLGRMWGYVVERRVAGALFLEVQYPKGRCRRAVAASKITAITPTSEDVALKAAANQWGCS
jgi:hypothetical protein